MVESKVLKKCVELGHPKHTTRSADEGFVHWPYESMKT